MKLPYFEYVRPKDLREGLDFLDQHGKETAVMAGGTDLLVQLKQRTESPATLLDLQEMLPGSIRVEESFLRIGPMARLVDIRESGVIQERFPLLAQAAGTVGAILHQSMGTIGGNICLDTRCLYYNRTPQWKRSWPGGACLKAGGGTCHAAPGNKRCFALYQGDMAAPLIALRSEIQITSSRGEKVVPLAEFFTGDGGTPHIRQPDEAVTEIRVPIPPGSQKGIYLKLRNRESIDFPLVGVALVVETDGKEGITGFRLVISGIHSAPVLVPEAADFFLKKETSALCLEDGKKKELRKLIEKKGITIDNACGSPRYRREMAGMLTLTALERISGRQ